MIAARLKRLLRALFGHWIEGMEDPELILKQNLRDLNDQVPKMNESIALVRTSLAMLEAEKAQLETRSAEIQARIRAALKLERRDLAMQYASRLSEIEENLATNTQQIEVARAAYEKALKVKQSFMRERERKNREAMEAIRAAERARWQSTIADVLTGFEIAGIDQTHEEMVQKINESAARDRARLQVALDSSDQDSFELDDALKSIQASEILKRFETPILTLPEPPSSPTADPTRKMDLGPQLPGKETTPE